MPIEAALSAGRESRSEGLVPTVTSCRDTAPRPCCEGAHHDHPLLASRRVRQFRHRARRAHGRCTRCSSSSSSACACWSPSCPRPTRRWPGRPRARRCRRSPSRSAHDAVAALAGGMCRLRPGLGLSCRAARHRWRPRRRAGDVAAVAAGARRLGRPAAGTVEPLAIDAGGGGHRRRQRARRRRRRGLHRALPRRPTGAHDACRGHVQGAGGLRAPPVESRIGLASWAALC